MATYPQTRYRYRLEIDGIGTACFSEVTGCESNVDVSEYREGNMPGAMPIKLLELRKYGNITLKWGLTSSIDVYNWMSPSFGTDVERKTLIIGLRNENNEDVARWRIADAWPVKFTAPEFSAKDSEIAIEQLELAHEGLSRTM